MNVPWTAAYHRATLKYSGLGGSIFSFSWYTSYYGYIKNSPSILRKIDTWYSTGKIAHGQYIEIQTLHRGRPGQISIFGFSFLVNKPLVRINWDKEIVKNLQIFTRNSRSHVRILIYRAWTIDIDDVLYYILQSERLLMHGMLARGPFSRTILTDIIYFIDLIFLGRNSWISCYYWDATLSVARQVFTLIIYLFSPKPAECHVPRLHRTKTNLMDKVRAVFNWMSQNQNPSNYSGQFNFIT